MYTYGYIREAVLAHVDLSEEEAQAMDLLKRLPIFANEAMQAICAVKPKYLYFQPTIVAKFGTVIEVIDGDHNLTYRLPTNDEMYYLVYGKWPANHIPADEPAPQIADEIATREFYHSQNVYEIGESIRMPDDFIAFAMKQCFYLKEEQSYNSEDFVNGDWFTNECETRIVREPITPLNYFTYMGNNTLMFQRAGQYQIPYKAIWFRFDSGLSDDAEIDMPNDLIICVPLYVAAQALQIDYAQKAQIKRSEFEIALSRATTTDLLPAIQIRPTFS